MKIAQTTLLFAGASLFLSAGSSLFAESVNTVPVGYTTLEIAAGTGTARKFTPLSLPLYQPTSSIDGAAAGIITGVTSDTLTVSGAGWLSGQLSDSDSPFCVRITTVDGSAEGRNLLISTSVENTSDTLTIDLSGSDVDDLTSLGLVADTDTLEIFECDTLATLFPIGDGGVIGAADIEDADQLWMLLEGTLRRIYYDTDLGFWTREVSRGSQPNLSNLPLMPDQGIFFSRKAASSSSMILPGTVPSTDRSVTINRVGLTFLGSPWPVDITLAQTGVSSLEGWVNGTSSSSSGADTVILFTDGVRRDYYFDGTNWRLVSARNPAISDTVVIGAGSAVAVSKATPYTTDVILTQDIPYTL